MGCRADFAGILGDLCTFEGHLPTGSPLSPILAYYSYHDMWAELAAFCTANGYTLTVYVDDVTISGANVPAADAWHVRPMIHRTRLRYHTLKPYADRPAEHPAPAPPDRTAAPPTPPRHHPRHPPPPPPPPRTPP